MASPAPTVIGDNRSSTFKLHRRYRQLFRLPSTSRAFTLLLISSLLVASIPGLVYSASPLLTVSAIVAVCTTSFVVIRLEAVILRSNPLGTARRLAIVSSTSNFVWLILQLIGTSLALLTSHARFAPLFILGMFFAASFKLLIMGSAFFERILTAIPVSLFQPVLTLMIVVGLTPGLPDAIGNWVPLLTGTSLVVLVPVYLILVDRSGFGTLKVGALKLLRSFLTAWAEDDPKWLEESISDLSSEARVGVDAYYFEADGRGLVMVVPEVHPGPFSPIGSSNLPYQLHKWFTDRGVSPMILHSISGHELNLPSKAEVEKLISSLTEFRALGFSKTCSHPSQSSIGRAKVTGTAWGKNILLTVTLTPGGMEDFPRWLKRELEAVGAEAGFEHTTIVDCHNCEDKIPGDDDCRNVLKAARVVCKDLCKATQYPFKVGYAHSSELKKSFERDIGPAGFTALLFEANERHFGFVAADANNAKQGVRELIVNSRSDLALEFCTSDTHVTAGKTIAAKGYIALGELTTSSTIAETVSLLVKKAEDRLHPSTVEVKKLEINARVVGGELLDRFSAFLDKVSRYARRLGYVLIAFSIFALIASSFI